MKDFILFRKNGLFYEVYDEDAIIINYLFNYKIKNNRVGFPISSHEKVINKLKEENIKYKDIDNEYNPDNNRYNELLLLSRDKVNLEKKVNEIINKIDKLDEEKLNKLLDIIKEFIDE